MIYCNFILALGFCVSLVEEEESYRKMIITDVKEGGLASSKGNLVFLTNTFLAFHFVYLL